ncbi:hypothetical protein [Teredinibacter waterburyi]|jgi:hypothetical protein|uniref:hypothetical protein n=1 Tax=Teredinibacter waterburyi TaxID=1500538 RepID=UPI00165F0429|nr:hypothetical protein [Teredinibacter waterburyi]
MFPSFIEPKSKISQGGFLLPLVIFLLVGVSMLAIAISRVSSFSGASSSAEGLSVQALFASESGLQWGMNQLFFQQTSRIAVDANCTTLENSGAGQTLTYSVDGLSSCTTQINCSISTQGATSYYTLESSSTCGGGNLLGQRRLQILAKMQ